jgi:hypothetical protein
MNRYTFKDVVGSKRASLAEDLDRDDDEEEDEEEETLRGRSARNNVVDGEEEGGQDQFNDAGEVLEPFNMKNERDQGNIDRAGNFAYFKREQEEVDAWVESMNEAAMEKGIGEAAEARRKREDARRLMEEEAAKIEKKSVLELKKELVSLMVGGETVAHAMRRYGGKIAASKKPVKVSKENRKIIERLTEIADQLLSQDTTVSGIYDMTREAVESSTVLWEYRGHDGLIQGPFTSLQISDWKKQGFFSGPSAVWMRRVTQADVKRKSAEVQDDPETKRVRIEAEAGTTKARHQEVADDFDDDSDDGLTIAQIVEKDRLKKEAAQNSAAVPVASATSTASTSAFPVSSTRQSGEAEQVSGGEWILSDDIDFGEFSKLPDDQRREDVSDGDYDD